MLKKIIILLLIFISKNNYYTLKIITIFTKMSLLKCNSRHQLQ